MAVTGLFLLAVAAGSEDRGARAEQCRALGFGPSLLCASCGKLAQHIGQEDALIEECKGCCTAEAEHTTHFARAVLDVCR
jgi:predicted amidophosphoribosyltransferase